MLWRAMSEVSLRRSVHDASGDQIGALEIPVDALQLGVARRGLQNP
jgi:hypothetical protein